MLKDGGQLNPSGYGTERNLAFQGGIALLKVKTERKLGLICKLQTMSSDVYPCSKFSGFSST